jgi:class 3 adenylate cyclase
VLVSQEVVDAASGAQLTFDEVGPVDLKGVAGAISLHTAHRAGGET